MKHFSPDDLAKAASLIPASVMAGMFSDEKLAPTLKLIPMPTEPPKWVIPKDQLDDFAGLSTLAWDVSIKQTNTLAKKPASLDEYHVHDVKMTAALAKFKTDYESLFESKVGNPCAEMNYATHEAHVKWDERLGRNVQCAFKPLKIEPHRLNVNQPDDLIAAEILAVATERMIEQGYRATHNGKCAYRDNNGGGCALGHFMPDEAVSHYFNNAAAHETIVLRAMGLHHPSPRLVQMIGAIQSALHDSICEFGIAFERTVRANAYAVAQRFYLPSYRPRRQMQPYPMAYRPEHSRPYYGDI